MLRAPVRFVRVYRKPVEATFDAYGRQESLSEVRSRMRTVEPFRALLATFRRAEIVLRVAGAAVLLTRSIRKHGFRALRAAHRSRSRRHRPHGAGFAIRLPGGRGVPPRATGVAGRSARRALVTASFAAAAGRAAFSSAHRPRSARLAARLARRGLGATRLAQRAGGRAVLWLHRPRRACRAYCGAGRIGIKTAVAHRARRLSEIAVLAFGAGDARGRVRG